MLKSINSWKIIFFAPFLLFGFLIFKDPFSQRTLIPNLEPFPDTIHYINPVLSFLNGEGFYITREGRKMMTTVPPLYSFTLIPAFIISKDVRVFYFVNVIMAFSSAVLFFIFLKKIFKNTVIVGLIFFLFVTNYFIYWVPTLAMAENLLLLIFVCSLLILILPINRLNAFLAGVLAGCFYATKYAAIPQALSLLLLYFIKIILEQKKKTWKDKSFIYLFLGTGLILSLLSLFDYFVRSSNLLKNILDDLYLLLPSWGKPGAELTEVSASPWFSIKYFNKNFDIYTHALVGKPMRFLWDSTPIVTWYVGILGLIGILGGLLIKGYRMLSFSFILFLTTSIVFLSTFYTFDGRYIYHAIPIILAGLGILLSYLIKRFSRGYFRIFPYLIIFIIFVAYILSSAIRLKSQISLNLRYAENPWYYIAVINLNNYFNNNVSYKDVVISALPPYFVDFYSNGKYKVLPLSKNQEFPHSRKEVWGENDYMDLIKLYEKYLHGGYNLYVSNHALGNEQVLRDDFNLIMKSFDVKQVLSGCYNTCNLYRLELKANDND